MNEYLLSVIIPAYNAEKYIDKCIVSLVNQTIFNKIEIIIIDDGSTDSTRKRLEKYDKVYPNIFLKSIENSGVSKARNIGIEQATGKYVTFLDADDWIEPACYEKMCEQIQIEKADVVATGLILDDDEKCILKKVLVKKKTILDRYDALKLYLIGDLDVHVVNKIYKKEIIKKVRFEENISIGEDRVFLYECLLNAQKVCLLAECFYHYYQNSDSAMHQVFTTKNFDNIIVGNKIRSLTLNNARELLPYAEAMIISIKCRLYGELSNYRDRYYKEFNEIQKEIKKYRIRKGIKYMSKKHLGALIITKISPKLFNKLRSNTLVRFK